MEEKEIFENLCAYDVQNPDVILDDSDGETLKPFEKQKECFCDNCFYRRDILAREILRLRRQLKERIEAKG